MAKKMKSILFRLYLTMMKLICKLVPIQNDHVVVLNGAGRSGSNGYLFYKYLRDSHPELKATLVEPWPSSHLPWSVWKKIASARYVFTTHQPFKIHRSQYNIQFWHGVPLKRMGFMANNTETADNLRNQKLWQKTDVIASSSDFYETLMTSCIGVGAGKYRKIGFPRMDYLDFSVLSQRQLLRDLFHQEDSQGKIGLYVPTFRYELEDEKIMDMIKAGNFLTCADFDAEKLNADLKERHQYLLVKLHPFEMRLFADLKSNYSNIAFLNNSYLEKRKIDLYQILAAMDFLMTDFSSIYFDYLKLDRPILFMTNHLKQYEQVRGLLFGPYKEVTPGFKVNSQHELIARLDQLDSPEMQAQRHYWYQIVDQVQAESNCDLVFDEIIRLAEELN